MRIEIKDLEVQFNRRVVLSIPELSFGEGRIYAIIGPNGSGKTTLLKAINLLLSPARGKILCDGREAAGADEDSVIRRRMTLLHQSPYLFSGSVYQNLAYGLKLRGMKKEEIRSRVQEHLKLAELEHLADRSSRELSGGEYQRVAITRALALGTEVLLLDEPTANVDRAHTGQVEELILKQKTDYGRTVIIATHTPPQAHRLADEILFLLEGKCAGPTPENFLSARVETRSGNKFLRLSPGVEFPVRSGPEGKVQVSLDPDKMEIIPAPGPGENPGCLSGTVTKAILERETVRLTISGEIEVVVFISRERFTRLKINLGSTVTVTIGPEAVKIHS
ncbi:MAG: phosphate ABC transporter ATP-binding protein [bacterium]|nr:phosphate ABC transporter ATP-binding protein [bacterium]